MSSATRPPPATTPAVRNSVRRSSPPSAASATSSRSTSPLSTTAPTIPATALGSTDRTVASGRVAAARAATVPITSTSHGPRNRPRAAITPASALRATRASAAPMSSTSLSCVPKVEIAAFFSQGGVRSTNASLTATSGSDDGPVSTATSSAAPSASRPLASPASAATRQGSTERGAGRRGGVPPCASTAGRVMNTACASGRRRGLRGACERRPHLRRQRPEGAAAVADGVLLGRFELGGGAGVALGHEDRVVAEAVLTARRPHDDSVEPALRHALAAAGQHESGRAGEPGGAVLVGHVSQLRQEQLEVRPVVAVPARPAGAEDAGRAAEHVDTQAGVVRDGRQPGGGGDGAGLEQGVAGEGRLGLGDVWDLRERLGPDHLDAVQSLVRQDAPQLDDLVRVPGGQHQPTGGAHERAGRSAASASCWWRASSRQPPTARSSRRSSSARSNAPRSAVPCTSTNRPSPVTTTFMSVPALTSST